MSDEVHLRPPQKMMALFKELLPLTNISTFFPNLHISFDSREDFVENIASRADATIFTGKEENARRVQARTKADSLFLFNGWGCNPIIVSSDADCEAAAKKVVEVKTFNSGQDCAGPDTILVHREVADQFINTMKERLDTIKVGHYRDPEVAVGKITEEGQLGLLGKLLLKYHGDIVYGGCIDFQSAIVHPTIIVSSLAQKQNFEELFAPVIFVSIYDSDNELAVYFNSAQYAANEMYVSLFGSSRFVKTLKRSQLLHEETILDVERGNDAYGGMSFGASYVSKCRSTEAKPILVPREIAEFVATKKATRQQLPANTQKKICDAVSQTMVDCFGSNLIFGFTFGSVAKGCATRKSDIDTMVVLKEYNEEQQTRYLNVLADYHQLKGMVRDEIYPAEIVTLETLKQGFARLSSIDMNLEYTDLATFDLIVWVEVFSGVKRGMVGQHDLLLDFAKASGRYPKIWKQQVLDMLERKLHDLEGDKRKSGAEQLLLMQQMKPGILLKRFIGVEHLSVQQQSEIRSLVRWDCSN
ncbi:MAG: hypothetical protein Q9227_001439 [Pyrenula ochraceoflavens]